MSDAPDKPALRLSDMIWLCNDEAERIETGQAAMVKAGLRNAPHAEQMRRAELFRATARLLVRIEGKWADVRRLLEAARGGRR